MNRENWQDANVTLAEVHSGVKEPLFNISLNKDNELSQPLPEHLFDKNNSFHSRSILQDDPDA